MVSYAKCQRWRRPCLAFTRAVSRAHNSLTALLVGEKTSLRTVLLPIAEMVGGELVLPSGEFSDTLIAGIAKRAAEDGRPVVVL